MVSGKRPRLTAFKNGMIVVTVCVLGMD
jgi:hypothetical protein